jgi:hypothetical protein
VCPPQNSSLIKIPAEDEMINKQTIPTRPSSQEKEEKERERDIALLIQKAVFQRRKRKSEETDTSVFLLPRGTSWIKLFEMRILSEFDTNTPAVCLP